MPLSEYENRIWEEMTSELDENNLRKVEEEEIERPYSLKMITSIILMVLGFAGMIASVAYKNTLTGVTVFIVLMVSGLMLIDALGYRRRRYPQSNKYDQFSALLRNLRKL